MRVIAFIPARMGASRFPGKPMAKINNIPMIGHCYFRTNSCKDLDDTYVATCDKEIFDYIKYYYFDIDSSWNIYSLHN